MTQPPIGPPPSGHGLPGYGPPPGSTQSFAQPAPPSGSFPAAPQQPSRKKRWPWIVAAVVVSFGLGAAANGGSGDAEAPAAATATVTITASAPAAPPPPVAPQPAPVVPPVQSAPVAPPSATAAPTPVVDFVMPDLVGLDLQSAQNAVQSNGVFFSTSHDLLGARSQVLDSNWIVCSQSVAPGQRVTGDVEGQIDFGAVKRGESCP